MLDINTFGLLFENLVNRDLSIYARKIGGTLKHYRDRYGLECDSIIHFEDGAYALIEIKLSGSRVAEAEKHLLQLKNLLAIFYVTFNIILADKRLSAEYRSSSY